ncbi:hypothetical protein JW921_10440, partial [Candidatus Fermentibacterales bacterium]|nr:hypothetical protein [Candidatus Fermentibacterales bacterium]
MDSFPRGRLLGHVCLAFAPSLILSVLAIQRGGEALWLIPVCMLASLVYSLLLLRKLLARRTAALAGLTQADREILRRLVSFYRQLSPEQKERFETDIAIF